MKRHPTKLIILFPIHKPVDYRQRLSGIDAALVVHRDPGSGEYPLELRPLVTFTARGKHGYAAALQRLAADLEAGYTVVIVDRDGFLADLEALARRHATAKDRDAVEAAAQVIAERTLFQIHDHLDTDSAQYQLNRTIIAARERRTRPEPHERDGINCRNGIPTPRAELMWHVIRHELTHPRDEQQGMTAWERWSSRNRPDMPRSLQDGEH